MIIIMIMKIIIIKMIKTSPKPDVSIPILEIMSAISLNDNFSFNILEQK